MKNKLLTALLSIALAFGLWLYVVTVVAPESEQTYQDVPVKLHGSNILESRGLMLISDESMTLDLELTGTRTDLNKLSSSNITIIADLSGITSAGEHTVHYSIAYPGSIASSITVLSPQQQTIRVQVVQWAKKEVPVTVQYVGQVPEGYEEDRAHVALDRTYVTVSGAKETVDRVEKAAITVDLTGQTEKIDAQYNLTFLDAQGQPVELVHATADYTQVTMVLHINMIKNIDIVVQAVPGGMFKEEHVECVPQLQQLQVSGPASVLEGLHEIVLTVDLGQITGEETQLLDISLPSGVTNETGVSQVAVDIRLKDGTKTLSDIGLSADDLINQPSDLQVEILTQKLAVQISGKKYLLDQIQKENIRLTVDLTGAVAGTANYQVLVEIVGIDGVTVEGSYTVKLSIRQEDPVEMPEE